MMTRKHFVAMADYIRAHNTRRTAESDDPMNNAFIRGMVSLAIHMGRTCNPRFDVDRFRKACGPLPPLSPR
jgi:hypothetical protein